MAFFASLLKWATFTNKLEAEGCIFIFPFLGVAPCPSIPQAAKLHQKKIRNYHQLFLIPLMLNMEINIYINPDKFQVMNFHRRLEETSFKSFWKCGWPTWTAGDFFQLNSQELEAVICQWISGVCYLWGQQVKREGISWLNAYFKEAVWCLCFIFCI